MKEEEGEIQELLQILKVKGGISTKKEEL